MVFRSPAAPDPARLSKSMLFKWNLKENRWFFDPRPLPTRPGAQNRCLQGSLNSIAYKGASTRWPGVLNKVACTALPTRSPEQGVLNKVACTALPTKWPAQHCLQGRLNSIAYKGACARWLWLRMPSARRCRGLVIIGCCCCYCCC